MAELIDFTHHPRLSEAELNKLYPPDLLLIIEDVLKTQRDFVAVFQGLIDLMKYGFERDELRKRPMYFKFRASDPKPHMMQLNHLISHLIFWQPLIGIDSVGLLDESWILDFTKFNSKMLMNYVNEKLLPIYDTDFATQNAMVDDLYHYIISISHAFCLLMGMGVSLYDLHQLELRDPEIGHLMRDPVDESLEPHEVEEELNQRNNRLIDRMVQDPVGNDYKPFFASGAGLKEAQFREYVVRIGYKADINGNTVPIFIDNNFLFHGLTKPSFSYLNALSGRKALILTKLSMGQPGAFSKKATNLSISSMLRDDYETCDSIHTISYEIKNREFLQLLDGRYFYNNKGQLCQLIADEDEDLIGKVIRFRSPMTCNSHEGVCRLCYGHMFKINQSMNSPGALASLKITEPIGQGILSSKHSQATHSSELKFSDGYDDVFETNSSMVTLREESDVDANVRIHLGPVEVEESDDSEVYWTRSFDLVDERGQLIRHIEELNGAKFYLGDQLTHMYKSKLRTKNPDPLFALEDLEDTDALFVIEVKNKELTDALKVFKTIMNSKDHGGAKTLDELCQSFAEKLIQLGIKYELVHMEMMLKALVRKKTNILEPPNYGPDGNPLDYQILKLDDAMFNHPNALVGMSYGYLRKALLSPDLYKKTAPGPFDPLAVSRLSDYLD